MTIFSLQSTLFTRASVALLSSNGLKRFSFSSAALYSPPLPKTKKRRFPIVSAVDIGGVTVARNDVVRDDDPTNNVPDSIFSKLGMQLHRRDKHPIGIIKNAIYDYFESNYANCYHQAKL